MRNRKYLWSFVAIGGVLVYVGVRLLSTHSTDEKVTSVSQTNSIPSVANFGRNTGTLRQPPSPNTSPAVFNPNPVAYTARSLPVDDLPLSQTVVELKNSAEKGNYLAGCRLAFELTMCKIFELEKSKLSNLRATLGYTAPSSAQAVVLRSEIKTAEQYLESEKLRCGGFSNDENFEPWRYLYQAALAGHLPSKSMFVVSPPVDPNEMYTSGEFLNAYKGSAGTFLIDAANAGMRSSVDAIGWAYLGPDFKGMFKPGSGLNLLPRDIPKAAVYMYASYAFPISEESERRVYDSLKSKLEALLTPSQMAVAKAQANALVASWRPGTTDWSSNLEVRNQSKDNGKSTVAYQCGY